MKGLGIDLAPLENIWEDYQAVFTEKLGLHRGLSLEQAIEIAGLNFEGRKHDGLWDARNTAELYRLAEDPVSYEQMIKPLRASVGVKEPATWSMADKFAGLLDKLYLSDDE